MAKFTEKYTINPLRAGLVCINPESLLLNDQIIDDPFFKTVMYAILNTYGHPNPAISAEANLDHYNTWFWHLPKEAYFELSVEEKASKYGMGYFSLNEDPERYRSKKYYDGMVKDIRAMEKNRLRAKDCYSPYWYAMAHTCHFSVILQYLMISGLRKDQQWYIISTPSHSFVANRPAKEIANADAKMERSGPQAAGGDGAEYFDILTDNVQELYTLAGNEDWWTAATVDSIQDYFKALVDDRTLILLHRN